MPYVVTESCIKCKYMDCVVTCPVHCFYEGENMLVINPDQCIDCAACEETCPVDAIVSDTDLDGDPDWVAINRKYSAVWPNILKKGTPPADAKNWEAVAHKFVTQFSPVPAQAD